MLSASAEISAACHAASPAPSETIRQTAAALCSAIQRLTEQEHGPQEPLFVINNFQHIAAFGRARMAFHKAMAARPNVSTDMFVHPEGDYRQAGEDLVKAVTALAIVASSVAYSKAAGDRGRESQHQLSLERLAQARSQYRRALDNYGVALGYPVYDPGALSYNRRESSDKQSPLYFD